MKRKKTDDDFEEYWNDAWADSDSGYYSYYYDERSYDERSREQRKSRGFKMMTRGSKKPKRKKKD